MAQQRILIVDAGQLEAWHAHAGRFSLELQCPASEDGHVAFERYVRQRRGSRFYLLTDVVEEGFQLESVPAVSGADRKALVSRRLNQYFYGTSLATAWSLGRERGGRRDERILFAALTRPAIFERWLEILRQCEAQVAGLWSAPLLAPALLEAVAPTVKRALLVSLSRGGIRQSFVEDGKLRFSRLAPQSGNSAADSASACESESAKIHQYLVGQRIIARGSVLPVIVLAHPSEQAVFERQLHSSDELEFVTADISRAANAIGLRDAPGDVQAILLFAQALLRKTPQVQFAPPDEQRFHHLGQLRLGLLALGGIVMLGCLTFAARQMIDTMTLRNQNETTAAQAQEDLGRYNNLLAALPPMPAPADDLRALIARYRDIEAATASPFDLLAVVSRALDVMQQVALERVEWSVSDNADNVGDARDQRAALNAGLNKPGEHYAIVTLTGALTGISVGNQREQLDAVNALAEFLRKDESLVVTVVRMPVDIESQRALRSEGAGMTDVPRFILRVARRLG